MKGSGAAAAPSRRVSGKRRRRCRRKSNRTENGVQPENVNKKREKTKQENMIIK